MNLEEIISGIRANPKDERGFSYVLEMHDTLSYLWGRHEFGKMRACIARTFDDDNFTVVAYMHDEAVDALGCFDTDVIFRMTLDEHSFDHVAIYSHFLRSTWYHVQEKMSETSSNLFLEELRQREWLKGLLVIIDDKVTQL